MKKCNFYGRYICIYGQYSYMDVKNSTAVSDRMKEYKVYIHVSLQPDGVNL